MKTVGSYQRKKISSKLELKKERKTMKRTIARLFSLVILMALSGPVFADNSTSWSTAQTILNPGTYQSIWERADYNGDEDYYKIVLSHEQRLNFGTAGDFDTAAWLYKGEYRCTYNPYISLLWSPWQCSIQPGALIKVEDDYYKYYVGGGMMYAWLNFHMDVTLPAGTYFLKVKSYFPSWMMGLQPLNWNYVGSYNLLFDREREFWFFNGAYMADPYYDPYH